MEPVFVTKMSVKGIGCEPGVRQADGKPTVLCHIFGRANGIKMGEDASGNIWQALKGSFAAIDLQHGGAEYRSGKLFLPPGIHETIEQGVLAFGENPNNLTIDFALEIRSVKATNPIGYSYQAVNLMPPTTSDELSEIRKAVIAARPASPAAIAAPNVESMPAQTAVVNTPAGILGHQPHDAGKKGK